MSAVWTHETEGEGEGTAGRDREGEKGDPWRTWLDEKLQEDVRTGRVRQLDVGREKDVCEFGSNDALGLSQHEEVKRTACRTAWERGMGPRGSALVCGHTELHVQLSQRLCQLTQDERCLLFPTGYAANLAVLGALGGVGCHVFSDELNHASIVDACRMAKRNGAKVSVYRHNDVQQLDRWMERCESPRKLVVTDSLFSMDGDFAELKRLSALKEKHDFWLAVDEAHATLVCGTRGAGAAEAFGVEHAVDIHIGTLSKAIGCHGGFVTTDAQLHDFLVTHARTHVYSTALPAPVLSAALAAIHVATRDSVLKNKLWKNVKLFSELVGCNFASHIAPILVGGEREALRMSEKLLKLGYHVTAIRPPTVPPGTSRLRVAISAAHSEDQIKGIAAALQQLGIDMHASRSFFNHATVCPELREAPPIRQTAKL